MFATILGVLLGALVGLGSGRVAGSMTFGESRERESIGILCSLVGAGTGIIFGGKIWATILCAAVSPALIFVLWLAAVAVSLPILFAFYGIGKYCKNFIPDISAILTRFCTAADELGMKIRRILEDV